MTTRAPVTVPPAVRAAQALFFLIAGIWLVFGSLSLLRLGETSRVAQMIIAGLMFGNVAALLVAGVGLGTRFQPWLYYLALAVLAVNILLTLTDEFGLFDLLTLVLDVGLLIWLMITRRHYARRK